MNKRKREDEIEERSSKKPQAANSLPSIYLPDEIWLMILEFVNDKSDEAHLNLFLISKVSEQLHRLSRELLKIYAKVSPWLGMVTRIAMTPDKESILKYLISETNADKNYVTMDLIQLRMSKHLKFAYDHGCPLQRRETCRVAATMGDLEALKFARENGCWWDHYTLMACILPKKVTKSAIKPQYNRMFDCFVYALENECPYVYSDVCYEVSGCMDPRFPRKLQEIRATRSQKNQV